jgi:hypothetical protein
MATKKLSKPMETVLLTADADGWIEKYNAPTHTSVALMDRGLVTAVKHRRHHDSDYPDALGSPGHWLTDAGKAKVAELRAAVARQDPNAVRCANPACGEPVKVRTASKSGYSHINPVLDGTHLAQPAMPQPEVPEIRAGDLIEIRRPNERRWAIRVEAYYGQNGWRGTQIRMVDGKPSRTRYTGTLKPGEYTIIERAKPAAEPCRGCGGRPMTSGGHNHRAGCETANPRAVAAEQPRKTVTASVKLTESQIDALHWLGAPTKVRETWYHPHGRTMKALRVRGLIANNELTHEGEAVYLASEPSARLPIEFRHAWAGTKALTSEPAPAVEPDGPACLADEPDNGWEAITAHGQLIYWRRKLSDQTWLAVRQIEAGWRWQHLGPRSGHVNAEGTNRTVNAARQAADDQLPRVEPDGPACLTDGEAGELSAKTRAAIAGMLGNVERERLPSLDELIQIIRRYGNAYGKSQAVAEVDLEHIRNVLRVLYREAGR